MWRLLVRVQVIINTSILLQGRTPLVPDLNARSFSAVYKELMMLEKEMYFNNIWSNCKNFLFQIYTISIIAWFSPVLLSRLTKSILILSIYSHTFSSLTFRIVYTPI